VVKIITSFAIGMTSHRNLQRELVSKNAVKEKVVRHLPHSKAMLPFRTWKKMAKHGKIQWKFLALHLAV
jgi:hypothetical protein